MKYQQMPKTATTGTTARLNYKYPELGIKHSHEPLTCVPSGLVFGTICHPHGWYLKAWSGGFGPRLDHLRIDNGDPRYFRTWMMELEEFEPAMYTKEARKVYAFAGEWVVDKFIRLENYEETLQEIVGPIENPFNFRFNQSARKHDDDFYYDEETRQRVRDWDGEAMQYFGYV